MKRLLYIAHRLPYPPDKGERVRAYEQLRALSDRYAITLAALRHAGQDTSAVSALGSLCEEVIAVPASTSGGLVRGAWRLMQKRSVTEGFFHSRTLHRAIQQRATEKPFDLVMGYSSAVLPYVLTIESPRIMDLVDADSAKWQQYADDQNPLMKRIYRREAKAVAALEARAIRECDATLIISDAERAELPEATGRVVVVGNGVRGEDFSLADVAPADLGKAGIVFTGTMDYRPNIEAVAWFVDHVWGEIKLRRPDATFTIVGRNPVAAVAKLGEVDGVTVTGSVPDVRPYLAGAALAVCPLQIARGVQNKLLEALAAGVCAVASTPAATGLDLTPDEHLVLADTPGEWADKTVALLDDPTRRAALAAAGQARVREHYTWNRQLQPLLDLCDELTVGR